MSQHKIGILNFLLSMYIHVWVAVKINILEPMGHNTWNPTIRVSEDRNFLANEKSEFRWLSLQIGSEPRTAQFTHLSLFKSA